jgi:hypothetical protein
MVYLTVDEVAADIRQRITTGKLWIGAYLSDEILAEVYRVGKNTVQLALWNLQEEGYLDEGDRVHKEWRDRSKTRGAYGITLKQNLDEVFEAGGDVKIRAYCFTSETIDGSLTAPLESLFNGTQAIGSLSLELVISDPDAPLDIPAMVGDPTNPFPRERLHRITAKHTRNLIKSFNALSECKNVGDVSIEIRMLPQTPTHKVIILNDRVLTGLYIPELVTILDEDMWDLRGWKVPLGVSRSIEKVETMNVWFDRWWQRATLAVF